MHIRTATIGTISHGTLRTVDLLERFADELEHLDTENDHTDIVAEARAVLTLDRAGWSELVDSGQASELVSELADALTEYAPAYCYFGSHEGDGSDFGFWPLIDQIEELDRIDDPSELDDIIGDECQFDRLYVNDHGNVTVYGHFAGEGWKATLELV